MLSPALARDDSFSMVSSNYRDSQLVRLMRAAVECTASHKWTARLYHPFKDQGSHHARSGRNGGGGGCGGVWWHSCCTSCVLKRSMCVHVCMLCECAMAYVEVRGHFRNMFLPSTLLRQGLFSCSFTSSCSSCLSCCCSWVSGSSVPESSVLESFVPVSHLAIGDPELWVSAHLPFWAGSR